MRRVRENELITLISQGKVLFVFITASWCGSCKRIEPFFLELENICRDKVEFLELDYDGNKQLMDELKIEVIPTVLVYKDYAISHMLKGTKEKEIYYKILLDSTSDI